MLSYEAVRHWTPAEAEEARAQAEARIQRLGTSVKELRYRSEEWDLDRKERELLAEYERFNRMVTFANRTLHP